MKDHFATAPVETPRERLVEAAIQEMERRGLSQLTVRAVAAAAQMNVAAVNYHFRSKQAHTEHVQLLSTHILGSHVDDAIHPEQRANCRGCDTMLTGTCFGDDSSLSHSTRK